ncbi:mTERF [Halocaridina rubra]|uniref:Transcription termination factor 3, mitochondrial n=1 Tax=Halocaridina rubra TaxID=373956 RepID=A0AAN8X168_HALRR
MAWRKGLLHLRSPLLCTIYNTPRRACSQLVTQDECYQKLETENKILPSKPKTNVFALSHPEEIDNVAPELRPSFNFAAYVNQSHTLQEMVRLGVDLTRWDKRLKDSSYILTQDFNEDLKQHIMFLHDSGVGSDDLGPWLSKNPLIFKEDLKDLQIRINYLQSKEFDRQQISRILTKNPQWLLLSTVDIDYRLGYFQRVFQLSNHQVRFLAAKQPRLITYDLEIIKKKNFSIREEMGFSPDEMKVLLLSKPKLWMAHYVSLMRRFDYAHNVMGLSHVQIIEFPKILTSRDFILKQRHGFLKLIGRDQYDCSKPNYVSPDTLTGGTDIEFCTNICKTSVQDFNNYIKTL